MNNVADLLFQVSVKGLFFDENGKILLIQEPRGVWEAPGGRIQKGENLIDALKRECFEETGIKCEVLERQPIIAYSSKDEEGKARLMLFYKIALESLSFVVSEECVDMKFFSKADMKDLSFGPTMKHLPKYL